MKYELVYTRRAERDIEKLEPNVKDRIGKALLRYSEEPLKFAEKLSDPILGEYRFRIGDYTCGTSRERVCLAGYGDTRVTFGGFQFRRNN